MSPAKLETQTIQSIRKLEKQTQRMLTMLDRLIVRNERALGLRRGPGRPKRLVQQ